MRIRLCIVTMTPELAYDAANMAILNSVGPVELLVAANCCHVDPSKIRPSSSGTPHTVLRFDESKGVVPAMHELWRTAFESGHDGYDDILCFIHDDCRILEAGWDGRVVSIFSTQPNADCIGLVGGTGIGADDIYRTPYQMIQLGRHNVHSAMVDAEKHGRRAHGPMKLATADGCALFVRRSFLDRLGGWSTWWPEPNHGYDNALACMLRRHGRDMWLLPLVFEHPSQLKLSGVYPPDPRSLASYARQFGTDQEVHAKAHQRLYDTFRDVLPFHV